MKRLVHAVLRVDDTARGPELPAGLCCVISGNLAAAYCEASVESLAPTLPRLQTFARAVAELHRQHTTIPFRFGCTFEADAELIELLRDRRFAWVEALERVDQCDEYSVHLQPHSGSPIPQHLPDRAADDRQTSESTDRPGTNYLMARRDSTRRASAIREEALMRAELVRHSLDGLYRSFVLEPPVAGLETLVTAVFLVPRTSAAAFLGALETHSHAGAGPLLVTGPWPPYHFTAPLSELDSSVLAER